LRQPYQLQVSQQQREHQLLLQVPVLAPAAAVLWLVSSCCEPHLPHALQLLLLLVLHLLLLLLVWCLLLSPHVLMLVLTRPLLLLLLPWPAQQVALCCTWCTCCVSAY
jgi:hypothetical protein